MWRLNSSPVSSCVNSWKRNMRIGKANTLTFINFTIASRRNDSKETLTHRHVAQPASCWCWYFLLHYSAQRWNLNEDSIWKLLNYKSAWSSVDWILSRTRQTRAKSICFRLEVQKTISTNQKLKLTAERSIPRLLVLLVLLSEMIWMRYFFLHLKVLLTRLYL